MKKLITLFVFGGFIFTIPLLAQSKKPQPKGTLFIIGGGDRPPSLVKSLLAVAKLGALDYIVVLPMSSEEPDTSYYYFKQDVVPLCTNTIANLNFTKENINNRQWLDSLAHAK